MISLRPFKQVALVTALLWPAQASLLAAEFRYMTDDAKIMLRSGQSQQHRILKQIDSGSKVELLSSDKASGYSKIRIDETEGFVLTQQLTSEPSAREQLEALKKRMAELQQSPEKLGGMLAQLRSQHQTLQNDFNRVKTQNSQLQMELEAIKRAAADSITTLNERNELRKQNIELTRELEDLKQLHLELGNDKTLWWYVAGVSSILGGIFLGLILPHVRIQRKHSSSWERL